MGRAMGIHGLFGTLGLASAPLLTGLLNWLGGPTAPFLVLGVLNLAGAGLMVLLPLPPATMSTVD